MSRELSKYLFLLKKKAERFERTDINGIVDESFCAKYLVKVFIGIISLFILLFLKKGFSEDFVSYTSSSLSIIVGLFITAMIFGFDKFYEPLKNKEIANSREKIWNTQGYNYAMKFAYITGYTIVLSVFSLVLLSISALFKEETSFNVFLLKFTFKNFGKEEILLFFISTGLTLQRFLVLYWLLRIIYNTLFIVSSMVQYMTTKIGRE